jgi:hypothetical protein
MADRFAILKATDVQNAPVAATAEDALAGAAQRSSVDGEQRVVVLVVGETSKRLPWDDEEEAPPCIGERYADALAPRPQDD